MVSCHIVQVWEPIIIIRDMEQDGMRLPSVAVAGGFTTEDQIFKVLVLGEHYISNVAIGRDAMAAAMSVNKLGELIKLDCINRRDLIPLTTQAREMLNN